MFKKIKSFFCNKTLKESGNIFDNSLKKDERIYIIIGNKFVEL